MSAERWEKLNIDFHENQHKRIDNPYNRNNRYFEQALMIHLMIKNDLIKSDAMLDWGSGNGTVSEILDIQFNHRLYNYDKFFKSKVHPIPKEKLLQGTFDFVLNTGVFEHVTSRDTLDEIEMYVNKEPSSCLGIHTLIPETIPDNPSWMYLLPVHCSFHTNETMIILMKQWGFSCSIYNPTAKLWVLFRKSKGIKQKVEKVNKLVGKEYLFYKEEFMDYWK